MATEHDAELQDAQRAHAEHVREQQGGDQR